MSALSSWSSTVELGVVDLGEGAEVDGVDEDRAEAAEVVQGGVEEGQGGMGDVGKARTTPMRRPRAPSRSRAFK